MKAPDKGPRILVVDDEHTVRELLVRALTNAGYRCTSAGSADDAAELVSGDPPDLALLDIRMPGKSGIELLGELVADYPDVAVLMVTAANDVRTAVKAMKLGAYDYLTKPFDLDDLLALVRMALENRELRMREGRHDGYTHRKVKELTERTRAQARELVGSLAREHELRANLDSARRSEASPFPLWGKARKGVLR